MLSVFPEVGIKITKNFDALYFSTETVWGEKKEGWEVSKSIIDIPLT